MTSKKIVVVGSLNMDLIVQTPRLPQPGETVLGSDFETAPGGKGANQAVAAARLAGEEVAVFMIGRVGEDAFGQQLIDSLQSASVVTDEIERVQSPTGIAVISVEAGGQNTIIVAPGANETLSPRDVEARAELLREADIVLLQLEIPLPTVARAAEIAAEGGARVILNPAPAQELPADLLTDVSVLIPNETEAATLTGETDPRAAAERLRAWGVPVVIVTLGSRGALLASAEQVDIIPGFRVAAVDTTAAGDAFIGALGVALAEGHAIGEAVRFANAAGALAVTRAGAQPSLPERAEVEILLTTVDASD